jgi:hypothetical protein
MNGSTAKAIAGALLTIGAMTAGVVLASGMPRPWTWCPGQDMTGLDTDTGRGGPGPLVQWDMSQCHTWYYVNWGYGNVTPSVWDGPNPPEEGTAIRQCPPITFMCP